MHEASPQSRLAVLIDAENVSHRLAERILSEAGRFGTLDVLRIYGDFEGQASSWGEAAARFVLEAKHCFAPGKNGADMRLTIDAMDLLHGGGIDGFCIVSSDSDFTELTKRIRMGNLRAFGIGNASAQNRFRLACTEYVDLAPAPAPEVAVVRPHVALPLIRVTLEQAQMKDGWYCLADFGSHAKKAGLVAKTYGAASLGALLVATGQFEFEHGKPRDRFRQVALRAVVNQ